MSFLDDPAAPVASSTQATATGIEAEASLGLGRLDGALAFCPPATLRLFAARLLRDTLSAALRQEGHAFTDSRFYAWFAGIATLSDEPPRIARPPRVVAEAVLTELAHSSWEPLAVLAARLASALLAPRDLDAEAAHEVTHAIVAAARRLVEELGHAPSPLPVPALERLHHAVGRDVVFAPSERSHEPIIRANVRLTVERVGLPSPRWAIEMLWGEHWRAAGTLRCALPFPGLIRLDAVRVEIDPAERRIVVATSLRDVAHAMFIKLAEADRLSRRIEDLRPGRRTTSRAPAVFELLAGFGPLRSSQIETLLGVTRLGVRGMLAALSDIGVLERSSLAGVRLYAISNRDPTPPMTSDPAEVFAFSHAAIDEYKASMADIDALLVRSGADLEEDAEDPD